jgi:hypothetical protein
MRMRCITPADVRSNARNSARQNNHSAQHPALD